MFKNRQEPEDGRAPAKQPKRTYVELKTIRWGEVKAQPNGSQLRTKLKLTPYAMEPIQATCMYVPFNEYAIDD